MGAVTAHNAVVCASRCRLRVANLFECADASEELLLCGASHAKQGFVYAKAIAKAITSDDLLVGQHADVLAKLPAILNAVSHRHQKAERGKDREYPIRNSVALPW
jgi:hypothetical protein